MVTASFVANSGLLQAEEVVDQKSTNVAYKVLLGSQFSNWIIGISDCRVWNSLSQATFLFLNPERGH